jgi:hypothetical protein
MPESSLDRTWRRFAVPSRRAQTSIGPDARGHHAARALFGMLNDLTRVTDAELDAAQALIAARKGVVLDLRGYPNRVGMGAVTHLADSTLSSPPPCVPVILRPDWRDTTWDCSQWKLAPECRCRRPSPASPMDATSNSKKLSRS